MESLAGGVTGRRVQDVCRATPKRRAAPGKDIRTVPLVGGVGSFGRRPVQLSPGAGSDLLHAVADVFHQVGLFARADARAGAEEVGGLRETLSVATVVPLQKGVLFVLCLCGIFNNNKKTKATV